MCGIAGVVCATGSPPRAALERMRRALHHRGPDDGGVAIYGPVGLVHTRLVIRDAELGKQPFLHPSTGAVMVYNGEVFDLDAMRTRLPEVDYRGHGDGEVLLHALQHEGTSALQSANGFFAFACLEQSQHRLRLGRDSLGVKPLYVARHLGRLWFASEIAALRAAGVPMRVNRPALRHTLRHRWTNGPDSLIEGVRRMPPGTVLDVCIDTLQTRSTTWYRVAEEVQPGKDEAWTARGRAEAVDALDRVLHRAVQRRVESDVPIGMLCSGGLDSSLLLAIARAQLRTPLSAYTVVVPGQPDRDEGPWARRVCEVVQAPWRSVEMSEFTWCRHLVDAVRHFEYPLVHESSVGLSCAARRARADGVYVLMGGAGADELFGGYPNRHRPFRHRRADAQAAAEAPSEIERSSPGTASHSTASPNGNESRPHKEPEPTASCEDEYIKALIHEAEAVRNAEAAYAHHPEPLRALEGRLAADLSIFLPHGLKRLDKNLMQHGVEYREPFLDREVVKFALNLPLPWRTRPHLKGIVRDLALRYLPPDVVHRPKVGFSFDTADYLRARARPDVLRHGRLREALEQSQETWNARLQRATPREQFQLWAAEIWVRTVVHGKSADALNNQLWSASATE